MVLQIQEAMVLPISELINKRYIFMRDSRRFLFKGDRPIGWDRNGWDNEMGCTCRRTYQQR